MPAGALPTGIGLPGVLVAISTGVTVSFAGFVTYAVFPSGVMAREFGEFRTVIASPVVPDSTDTCVIESLPAFAIYATELPGAANDFQLAVRKVATPATLATRPIQTTIVPIGDLVGRFGPEFEDALSIWNLVDGDQDLSPNDPHSKIIFKAHGPTFTSLGIASARVP